MSKGISKYKDEELEDIGTLLNKASFPELIGSFSVDKLEWLIDALGQYTKTHSIDDVIQVKIMHWLTFILHRGVKDQSNSVVSRVSGVVLTLIEMAPDSLASLFTDTITLEPFKGQNVLFAWVNELYSATFDLRNYGSLIAINYILSKILDTPAREDLLSGLTKTVEQGTNEGENALIVLIQALQSAAKITYNQPSVNLLANLLAQCMRQAPDIVSAALTKQIEKGSLKGKTAAYLLTQVLKIVVKDNPAVVQIICTLFAAIHQSSFRKNLAEALSEKITIGPYKGLNSLHIILKGLVSATFIKEHDAVIFSLTSLLQELFRENPRIMMLALAEEMASKEILDAGIPLLFQALLAAINHNNNPEGIINVLFLIVELNTQVVDTVNLYSNEITTTSPISLLVNRVKNIEDPITDSLRTLIKRIAASPQAIQFMLSLPLSQRNDFVEYFAKIYFLNLAQVGFLVQMDNTRIREVIKTRPDETSEVNALLFFLYKISNTQSIFVDAKNYQVPEIVCREENQGKNRYRG